MKTGYYIFLGNGDYHSPVVVEKNWVSSWNIDDWKAFIQELVSLEVDTLMIYLNGHKLPYNSQLYPQLVDHNHPNVQNEFLPDLLKGIKQAGISLFAVITTTGHAGGFVEISPESMIEARPEKISIEETLISFPEHLRKGKSTQKEGAAQVGFGVLCHHKTSARIYAENILKELINIYGHYFDGIAFHPPEAICPCYCDQCCEYYKCENNEDLRKASLFDARRFFITSYLNYQNQVLVKVVNTLLPLTKILSFTVPWLFESNLKDILPFLSKDITIIDWDYNLDNERVTTLAKRMNEYQSRGYEIWFMPSAGFSFSKDISEIDQINGVHAQIEAAEASDVAGIIHFLGPKISDYLIQTSRKYLNELKTNKHSP